MVDMTSLLKNNEIYSLAQLSKFVKAVLSKSCSTIVDNTEDDDEEVNIISNSLSNISQQNFRRCQIYDKINSQQMKKYF